MPVQSSLYNQCIYGIIPIFLIDMYVHAVNVPVSDKLFFQLSINTRQLSAVEVESETRLQYNQGMYLDWSETAYCQADVWCVFDEWKAAVDLE